MGTDMRDGGRGEGGSARKEEGGSGWEKLGWRDEGNRCEEGRREQQKGGRGEVKMMIEVRVKGTGEAEE